MNVSRRTLVCTFPLKDTLTFLGATALSREAT